MIVESMNFAELEREVLRDFEKLRATTELRLSAEYDTERRKFKIDKTLEYPKMYTVKTASKNTWLLFIRKNPCEDFYKNPLSTSIAYVTYYYNAKGLSVIQYTANGIELYYGHFFKRYNERMNLGLKETMDAAKKYFFDGGGNSLFKPVEKNGKTYKIAFSSEGILLGEIQYNGRLHVNKTFVSRSIAFESQDDAEKQLIAEIRNEIMLAEVTKTTDTDYNNIVHVITSSQKKQPAPSKKTSIPDIPHLFENIKTYRSDNQSYYYRRDPFTI